MKWNFRLLPKMGQSNYKFWMGIVTVAECVCLQRCRCQQTFEKFFQCMENMAEKHIKFPQEWKMLRNLIPPKKERSAFRVRAFFEYCDVYRNFVVTSTWLTGALGCPTTEAGQRKERVRQREGETRLNSDPGLHWHCCCGSGIGFMGLSYSVKCSLNKIWRW